VQPKIPQGNLRTSGSDERIHGYQAIGRICTQENDISVARQSDEREGSARGEEEEQKPKRLLFEAIPENGLEEGHGRRGRSKRKERRDTIDAAIETAIGDNPSPGVGRCCGRGGRE